VSVVVDLLLPPHAASTPTHTTVAMAKVNDRRGIVT